LELLEFVDDVVDDLGSGIESIESIKSLNEGDRADRQWGRFLKKPKTFNDVVDFIFWRRRFAGFK